MGKSREELEKEIIQFLDEGSTKKGDMNAKCALKHGIASVANDALKSALLLRGS